MVKFLQSLKTAMILAAVLVLVVPGDLAVAQIPEGSFDTLVVEGTTCPFSTENPFNGPLTLPLEAYPLPFRLEGTTCVGVSGEALCWFECGGLGSTLNCDPSEPCHCLDVVSFSQEDCPLGYHVRIVDATPACFPGYPLP